ncbi:hypothetical protein SDC9_166078 [bioreactor metagenome]|uniref:Uncharacterized protein n=1 Tax=bioreactor metagenome TaxID=1076179 RepID=A0A645FW94_9ZZZZ
MDTLPRIEGANAFWTVELMRGQRQHVDVLRLYVDMQMPCGLYRVSMKEHAFFTADRADPGNRLYGANFVVCVHHRHKAGVPAYG